jgi:hypothetical protein
MTQDIRDIRVERILDHCPILDTPPWEGAHDLTKKDVQRCLDNNLLRAEPTGASASLQEHAARIAYLVRHGWDDAISIDVGVPWMPGWHPTWCVEDGNHRLYAAAFKNDATILVEAGGCLTTFEEWFGK